MLYVPTFSPGSTLPLASTEAFAVPAAPLRPPTT
jgi:hypothetical protein